ncbi:hypothetical protein RHGRI_010235 [Rhododendron griersonianum]|uniref:Wall-associated receptor kinase galacturonan-binding domain-containing protein n=1 Tax=Rhododendron griersonianum TaxID=479676 RepID=A0AAV6KHQ3_9ERIC|nr:hypothetical protein RHGRI_010235 [Rhododendron griersonianum]
MYLHVLILLFFSRLLLAQPTVLAKNITANIANVTSTSFLGTKPGCQRKCGNLSVPYPFSIGAACSFDLPFVINCSNSEPFIGNVVVLSISPTQVRVQNEVASMCYNKTGAVTNDSGLALTSLTLPFDWPYTFSDTANKLTVVGCDDLGELWADSQDAGILVSACGSIFSNSTDMTGANCPGIGCCQTDIPKGLKTYNVSLSSFYNHTQVLSKDKCGYAFVGEQDSFHYSNLQIFRTPISGTE